MDQQSHHDLVDRLAELSARAGNYALLFLSFAPLAAATILQIPVSAENQKFLIVPNHLMVLALRTWMVAAVPILISILPVTEFLPADQRDKWLHRVRIVKIALTWTGTIAFLFGIRFFFYGFDLKY